ncbi:hypothetical protein J6590_041940 [Homalodisca vitripennis]|nr:hypothetical protein J6590_041940 [Homalodisca vitripennis]
MRPTSLQLHQFNKPPKTTYQVLLGKFTTPVQNTKDGIPLSCYCNQRAGAQLVTVTESAPATLLPQTVIGGSNVMVMSGGMPQVKAKIGDESITIKAQKGCPQGGVLSPLLWAMTVDDLTKAEMRFYYAMLTN